MDVASEKPAQPRRRWLRFSLRTLLIVVTVPAFLLGWIGWKLEDTRLVRETVAWVEEKGGTVRFDNKKRSWWEESTSKWFGGRVHGVDLRNTQVSDLSPLAELRNLYWLDHSNTHVSDLSPLSGLKNIRRLNFSNTRVSDLSPLVELKNLKMLWLNNTLVSDLSPLRELMNLNDLLLQDTQVSDEQVQELRQALPNCKISHSMFIEQFRDRR